MGLDCIAMPRSKPGHEAEWNDLIAAAFEGGDAWSDAKRERLGEIGIPAYASVGAPQVGRDRAADEWICENQKAESAEDRARAVSKFAGLYVLELASGPGLPRYTNGAMGYDGLDTTSFRGQFFASLEDRFEEVLLNRAWNDMWPSEAVRYGWALFGAAQAARAAELPMRDLDGEDPIAILESASRWYIFWGDLGHPIKAWF